MKTYEDLEMEINPQRLKVVKSMSSINESIFGFNAESKRVWFLQTVISEKPHIINQYKHLVDMDTLKEVIDEYPQTKIYLE